MTTTANQGSLVVKTVELVGFDGSTKFDASVIFQQIDISQSIFRPYVSGKIYLIDSSDLYERMPLIGEETLNITFTNDEESLTELDGSFSVYKVETSEVKDGVRQLTLHFCSPEMITNFSAQISKQYKGSSSDIIQSILKNDMKSEKPFEFDSGIQAHNFLMPNLYPVEAIQHINKITYSGSAEKASAFFFWEDVRGYFHRDLYKLYEQEVYNRYFKEVSNTNEKKLNDRSRLVDMVRVKTKDNLDNLMADVYSVNMFSVDPFAKKTVHKKRKGSFRNIDNSAVNLSSGNSIYDSVEGTLRVVQTKTYTGEHPYISGKTQVFPQRHEEFADERDGKLASLNNMVLDLTIEGDQDVYPGFIVEVEIRQNDASQEAKSRESFYYSGKHIVLSVTHKFVKGGEFSTMIEVAKDCYSDQIKANIE